MFFSRRPTVGVDRGRRRWGRRGFSAGIDSPGKVKFSHKRVAEFSAFCPPLLAGFAERKVVKKFGRIFIYTVLPPSPPPSVVVSAARAPFSPLSFESATDQSERFRN
ncbi:hypothetical protein GWI33_003970 [Rhynchophorus ferrugineus]|uniref:Uncharacterized protein n=1 Tax=Rhynchophorus ferrugineus TaxID=354439 RepID=A0A834IQN8_RHYFE|nr:hypothetical protein GWI33_003970 [Rhynchophorus ferrugineus]